MVADDALGKVGLTLRMNRRRYHLQYRGEESSARGKTNNDKENDDELGLIHPILLSKSFEFFYISLG